EAGSGAVAAAGRFIVAAAGRFVVVVAGAPVEYTRLDEPDVLPGVKASAPEVELFSVPAVTWPAGAGLDTAFTDGFTAGGRLAAGRGAEVAAEPVKVAAEGEPDVAIAGATATTGAAANNAPEVFEPPAVGPPVAFATACPAALDFAANSP